MKQPTLALVVLVTFLSPAQAFAWFGWLDRLRGPGPSWGVLFEARVWCFSDESKQALVRDAQKAEALAEDAEQNFTTLRTPELRKKADDAWLRAVKAWQAVTGLEDELGPRSAALAAQQASVVDSSRQSIAEQRHLVTRMAAVGVLFSLCKPDIVRRSSIDIAKDFWWARRDPAFAGGERIRLSQAKVSYSFALFREPSRDVVDLSIGIGAYWFTSKGFDTVSGVFLEPARVYFHAPSAWGRKSERKLKRLLAIPVLSVSSVLFPGGFEAGAFGQERRIGTELVPTASIFVNVHRSW